MEFYKCRLCLEETNRYVEIFSETFADMIETLTGLKVEPEDGLPTTSCLKCHQEVKSAMLTRYQIIKSHKILTDPKYNVEKCLNEYCSHTEHKKEVKNELPVSNNEEAFQNVNIKELKDCDDVDDFHYEENNRSDPVLSDNSMNSLENEKIKIEKSNPAEEKNGGINNELRKRKIRKTLNNKDIKFRKKKLIRQRNQLEHRIEFRKKKPPDNANSKMQYDIKPEYLEFLKTFGRKDRVACPECGRVMFGMNMKNHLITHNYDPVNCDICGKTSKNAQALQDHINYYHKTTPDRFMCDKCGKGYRVRFMLERHEKKEHGNGEKDFECSICGKKFFEKLHLKNHINITHNKLKAYKCEHCGKDFGRRTQFVTHQLVHTKENRYHCQVCGKGFKIKQTMQTHLKGVHGIEEEKTIFCKLCQKGFSTPQGLRAHVNSRVHGLEKCEHCSEFITVEYKNVHLRDIHGINNEISYS